MHAECYATECFYPSHANLAEDFIKMLQIFPTKGSLVERLDELRGRYYDFIHNVDTFSGVGKASVKIESENKSFGTSYQRTPIRTIEILFRRMSWSEGTAFIDVGCGKGLILLAAARYPFSEVIGVEYSSDLVSIARRNIERYRGKLNSREKIAVVHTDAAEFLFPSVPSICYFFNPFSQVVMERVLDNLVTSIQKYPREMCLVFHSWHSRDLVLSKFNIANIESIPYFYIYRLAAPRGENFKTMPDISWKTIDTKLG